ncbi:hypothetical protein SLS61_004442 [Didymella pomorum]
MADTKQEQNIQILYSVLTVNGNPTIDWDPVCAALELEKVAVTKRWLRLKLSINKGEKPDASNEQLLWLMVKHSERKKVGSPTSCFLPPHRRHSQGFDWVAIAEKCGSTKGAVSKRYSRMKLAFERGDEPPPSTPTKGNKAAATPKKTPSKAQFKTQDDEDGTPTTTSKRKRTPAKKKACSAEAADDEDEQDDKPKRVKSTPKARPRPKNAFRASDENRASEEPRTVVKGEPVESDGDVFMDAPEQTSAEADAKGDIDEISPTSVFSEQFAQARELANVLLDRKTRLNSDQRKESEGTLESSDDAV